jgi:hypothetical protein
MERYRLSLLFISVFFSFLLTIFNLPPISLAETLHGTPQNDTITSTGIYDGIISYEGDDTILIESSSQIIWDSQQTAKSTAAAEVTAVDAGSGDDRVANDGSIGAIAGADATAVDVALTISGSRDVYTTQWTAGFLPELWYHYMTESDNYHDGTHTRWIADLSAATCKVRANIQHKGDFECRRRLKYPGPLSGN